MSTEHKTPKKKDSPTKKKFLKFHKMRNPIIVSSLIAVFAVAGILGGLFFLGNQDVIEEKDTLILGLYMGPQSFDPFYVGNVATESFYLFDQVTEGLFEYDHWNTTDPIINNLAKSAEWSIDGLNFTCTLRTGIKFHDDTPFNAFAVKWNIDRLHRLLHSASWWIPDLWRLPDSLTPIVNETIVLDEYIIRFVLNEPYVPFKALLMHFSSFILSPTSTPSDRLINMHNETMIGTGPFKMDSFEIINDYGWGVTSNTTLIAYQEYWNGIPDIDEVLFKAFFNNDTERYGEMISGKLSFTYSMDFYPNRVDREILEICKNTPEINVVPITNAVHYYINMNYVRINSTMRKAVSYAYNYTHDYEKIFYDYGERLQSYIPYHYFFSNWTAFDVPVYNITKARQVLKNSNWPGTELLTANSDISPGNEWEVKANSPMPLETYNTSFIYDNKVINDTTALLIENLKQLGVKLELFNMTQNEYYDAAGEGRLDFSKSGYYPDYEDPNNVISALFSNLSYTTNYAQYNDPLIQQMIKDGIAETNPITRKQIYYDIQEYLIEESYPYILLYNQLQHNYWNSNIGGVFTAYRSDFTFLFKDLYIN